MGCFCDEEIYNSFPSKDDFFAKDDIEAILITNQIVLKLDKRSKETKTKLYGELVHYPGVLRKLNNPDRTILGKDYYCKF